VASARSRSARPPSHRGRSATEAQSSRRSPFLCHRGTEFTEGSFSFATEAQSSRRDLFFATEPQSSRRALFFATEVQSSRRFLFFATVAQSSRRLFLPRRDSESRTLWFRDQIPGVQFSGQPRISMAPVFPLSALRLCGHQHSLCALCVSVATKTCLRVLCASVATNIRLCALCASVATKICLRVLCVSVATKICLRVLCASVATCSLRLCG
jgi:hypothetical protein